LDGGSCLTRALICHLNMAPLSVPPELMDVMSWNPPLLDPLPGKKMSKSTRHPAFFDKHFTEGLRLLHVKRLPSLVHDITAIVDKSIESFNNVQFPPSDEFYSAKDIGRTARNIDENMADEKAVASFYDKTTASFCAPVASTLALGVPGLLMWTQSANVTGYAIADGFLKFAGPKALKKRIEELRKTLDEETFKIFLWLAEHHSSLMTYEIKNLAAGGPEVMYAIPNLSNSPTFPWTICTSPDCASNTKHAKERQKVNDVVVGADAKKTLWTLDSGSNSHLEDREGTFRPQEPTPSQPHQIGMASTSAQLPDSVLPQKLSTPDFNMQTTKAEKRKRGDDSDNQSTVNSFLFFPMDTTHGIIG
jgi:hypothetical protein